MALSCISSSSQSLVIREIKEAQDLECVGAVVDAWRSTALEIKNRRALDGVARARLLDCSIVCFGLVRYMPGQRDPQNRNNKQIFLVEDQSGKTQAIMSLDSDSSCTCIRHLVTNPENLIPDSARRQGEPMPVRGAATALMEEVMRRELVRGGGVFLESLSSSFGFYEKMGLEELPRAAGRGGAVPMVITADKIRSMYPHFIFKNEGL